MSHALLFEQTFASPTNEENTFCTHVLRTTVIPSKATLNPSAVANPGKVMFCACPQLFALDFPEAVDVPEDCDVTFYGCFKLKRDTLFKTGSAALAVARAAAAAAPPEPEPCEHCKNFGSKFCPEHKKK